MIDSILAKDEFIAAVDEQGTILRKSDILDVVKSLQNTFEYRPLIFALTENCIGSVCGYVAFLEGGWPPLMLNSHIDRGLLKELMDRYTPTHLWVPDRFVSEFAGYDAIFTRYGYTLLAVPGAKPVNLHKDLSLLLSTSGSTGSPKLVRTTYKNIICNATSIAEYLEIKPTDKPITILPMSYSYGLSVINSHLLKGATILVTNRSVIENDFWEFFNDGKATFISGVPYTYETFLRIKLFQMSLPTLQVLTQSGASLPEDIAEIFAKHAKEVGWRFYKMYGQSEGTSRLSYMPYKEIFGRYGSIGKAIPGGEFKLEDEQGNEITAPDQMGELIYRGGNVTMGYAEKVEDLALGDVRNGVLRTGDLAKRDADGYYYLVGRKKRFIKLFGNRVSLDQTEKLLTVVVDECACVGRDDKMTIYITDPNKISEVRSCAAHRTGIHLSGFKVVAIDKIPRNASGKILYSALKPE